MQKRVKYASKIVPSASTLRVREQAKRERAAVRAAINELKNAPCEDCRQMFDPICMGFDHRPGERKISSIAALVWAGMERVRAEIAKCDLVCANCHRIRTRDRR